MVTDKKPKKPKPKPATEADQQAFLRRRIAKVENGRTYYRAKHPSFGEGWLDLTTHFQADNGMVVDLSKWNAVGIGRLKHQSIRAILTADDLRFQYVTGEGYAYEFEFVLKPEG